MFSWFSRRRKMTSCVGDEEQRERCQQEAEHRERQRVLKEAQEDVRLQRKELQLYSRSQPRE